MITIDPREQQKIRKKISGLGSKHYQKVHKRVEIAKFHRNKTKIVLKNSENANLTQ